jgi:uncharacterized protein (DUF427 family)
MSFNEVDFDEFIKIANTDNRLTNGLETYFATDECKKKLKEIHGQEYEDESLIETFYLFYEWNEDYKHNFGYIYYNNFSKTLNIELYSPEDYKSVHLLYDMAKQLKMTLYNCDKHLIVNQDYLEALRIKEENRGIKLTKEQSHVLSSVEDQCRWWYIPTDDVSAVFSIFGLQPDLKEADITEIIDDVQFENKIVVASFTGHTILFGFNAPYIAYPNLNAYLDIKDQHTPHLQNTLNKLSKTFGTAAYFEYNNDDEMIASLAWSTKGKFVYGRFTSEGEGMDVFGTQKKAMEVNQKTILKTAKKLGITPEDILTGLMKQKQKVRFFTQKNWFIEEKLKR